MATLLADLRYALRMLRKQPLFTAIAVLTLALGIGLNTAVFAAVEALLLRPLPGVRRPAELVQLFQSWPGIEYGATSIPHFIDVRDRGRDAFSGVAAWDFVPLNLAVDGRPERVMGQMVSANFFAVLGAGAERGRTFVAEEDVGPGAHPVVVLSDATWRTRFGADPAIVGRAVTVNGQRYTVVGVMPREFKGPAPIVAPAMWVPLMQIGQLRPGGADRLTARGWNFMNVVARLAPGVSAERARDRLAALQRPLAAEYPRSYENASTRLVPQAEAGIDPRMRAAQVGMSSVVMAVVVMLLLIACVNVANLFLARARDRWREMAVRLSLGAPRGRLVRQLLTESLVFSLLAGGAGVALARGVIALGNRIRLPMDIPLDPDLRLSVPVLAFALGVSLLTGVLFGLAPALQATRPGLIPALKGEAPVGGGRSRMSRSLVVAQMALSLVLLVSAGLFLRNLRAAATIDTGFVSGNVLVAGVDPGLQGYDRARAEQFFRTLVARLRAQPTVRAVALAEALPLRIGSSQRGVVVPGYTPSKNEQMSIDETAVSPGYFEAMGIRLLRGRAFTERDDSAAAPVLVVNQRVVERFWRGQDPLGKVVRVGGRDHTVVGVVPTGKYRSLGEEPLAFMYFSLAQSWDPGLTVVVRTATDPAALAPVLRSEVAALDPDLPLTDVRTMTNHLGVALLPARLAGAVLGVFGVLGLVLAAVGIYGVMSYSVAQRTREIGIRMAVGAATGQVLRLVLRQGLGLVALGAAVGLAGGRGAARRVGGLLYGGSARDPMTFVVVPLVLVGVAVLAMWIPARRAAAVDPIVALRRE
jgi:predicted permease